MALNLCPSIKVYLFTYSMLLFSIRKCHNKEILYDLVISLRLFMLMPVNCYLVDTKYKNTNYIYSDKNYMNLSIKICRSSYVYEIMVLFINTVMLQRTNDTVKAVLFLKYDHDYMGVSC